MKSFLSKLFGAFLGLVLLCIAAAGWWAYHNWQELNTPLESSLRYYEVPRGTSFNALLADMSEKGLNHDPLFLKVYARLDNDLTQIKAGEYAVLPQDSTWDLLQRIQRGEVAQHAITVPEGWSILQIAPALEAAGIADAAEFIELAMNPDLPPEFGLESVTLEGFLFPDTYFFARGHGAKGVIDTMVQRFWRNLPDDYEERAQKLGLTKWEAIVLASIIEKETGQPSERKVISGVFHNRLRINMRLQSDPTVTYGVEGFEGRIRRRHLNAHTPYNTYRINGLPPGPIASPGLDSIIAAVEPADVPYYYFVSKNDGSHYFSTTYREHNKAVDLYQRSGRSSQ